MPPLCLGTMTFGEADAQSFMHRAGSDEATSFDIANRAVDAGVNFFDTADVYGQDGLSERVIGEWFARDGRRDDVLLATKCRFRMGPGPNGTGASRRRILAAAEASLRRLRTDRIDLYQIHMQDIETPEEETLRALDDLVRAGKVLYTGLSNYAAYRLVDSVHAARRQGLTSWVSAQMQYSLLERSIEREHVPACEAHGLGVLPWSPLAGGFLSGKYVQGAPPPSTDRLGVMAGRFERLDRPRNWAILEVVRQVAAELSSTPTAVSIAWLLTKRSVSSVIFGARTAAQLDANLAGATLALPDDAAARLDAVSQPDFGYPYEFIRNVQGRW